MFVTMGTFHLFRVLTQITPPSDWLGHRRCRHGLIGHRHRRRRNTGRRGSRGIVTGATTASSSSATTASSAHVGVVGMIVVGVFSFGYQRCLCFGFLRVWSLIIHGEMRMQRSDVLLRSSDVDVVVDTLFAHSSRRVMPWKTLAGCV